MSGIRAALASCLLAALCGAVVPGGSAMAAGPPPTTVDCSTQPCAEVMPGASSFRPVSGASYWEGLDADGEVVGWLALSTDLVEVKAYSGKPLVTLVGLDTDGIITGARVVHHSEPILLVGIPEQALHDFVDFYAGKSPLQRIVVGRASQPDMVSVDAISGATVTVLAQNQTVLDTARALGAEVGVFPATTVAPGHFVAEDTVWSFAELLERGAVGRLTVTNEQMGLPDGDEPYVDLYFAVADAPQVGRALLGDHEYEYYLPKLETGEHLFVVFNRGEGSFKGSAFVRGGIFDRVRLQQGLREITFRDIDYHNLPDAAADDAPEFEEGALFILRGGRFDPGAPYELVFLGSRYDRRGAFSREFHEFSASHEVPDSVYVVERREQGIPWRQAWSNRRVDVVLLLAYLVAVIAVFSARRWTTADPKRIKRLHIASLVVGFLLVGVYMRAQPSVTQILTAVGSAVGEWRWELFLSEPLIFILWIFIFGVAVTWGRGVFCGWVCPYGAMTELAFKASERLGWKGLELPDRFHVPLRYLRYGILFVLVGVFLWDSILAERLAEVEPFKSTFLVPAWTRGWGFFTWWAVLLGISFVSYRPFCRYVCPLGGGLALLGSARFSGPRRRVFCSSCKICTRGCEPRAFREDGTIDPRECLSCMDCEAVYRNEEVCPPLVGIRRLEARDGLRPADEEKLVRLRIEARDV
jgi:NosR/NirI family nitrous oxide reductase transcriptional regulator